MIKYFVVALIAVLVFLQYRLWFEANGVQDTLKIKKNIAIQKKQDQTMLNKNKAIMAEVNNLKHGKTAIEDRAREELGMIKKGETFYLIVPPNQTQPKEQKNNVNE